MLRSKVSEPPCKICRTVGKQGSSGRLEAQFTLHCELASELSIEKREIGFGWRHSGQGKVNAGFDARILKSRIISCTPVRALVPVCASAGLQCSRDSIQHTTANKDIITYPRQTHGYPHTPVHHNGHSTPYQHHREDSSRPG
jgi:hypothetical protein